MLSRDCSRDVEGESELAGHQGFGSSMIEKHRKRKTVARGADSERHSEELDEGGGRKEELSNNAGWNKPPRNDRRLCVRTTRGNSRDLDKVWGGGKTSQRPTTVLR